MELGFVSKSSPPAAAGGVSFGWDSDLTAVPAFRLEGLSNATAAQVEAGLSVVAGELVIDTNAMVAAGATEPIGAQFYLPIANVQPGFAVRINIEELGAPSSIYNDFFFRAFLKDAAGVSQTPPGGTQDYVGFRFRNDGFIGPYIWNAASFVNTTTNFVAAQVQTSRFPAQTEIADVRSTNAAYAPAGGATRNGPRSLGDAKTPDDWYVDARFRINQGASGNPSERIYKKIPLFSFTGLPADS